jgi:cell filamentation protein
MTPDQRDQLEADHTFRRVVELELDPVRGHFDAAHLKEVNRRIFQDLLGAGFEDVTPGEFRPPVPDGKDWMKQRRLSTVESSFYVAYSRMDAAAVARLELTLEAAKPDELRNLATSEFAARLTHIYAELDYVHPFKDGNSRTLRTFTRQLARESGYALDWERFSRSDVGRDLLYIARDRSVNELAKPHIQLEQSMRKIVRTTSQLEGNADLQTLLRDAVRPSRAIAFERLMEPEALTEHPELEEAYKTVHTAAAYFESTMPGKTEAQKAAVELVVDHVQACLNDGKTRGFGHGRNAEMTVLHAAHPKRPADGTEHER